MDPRPEWHCRIGRITRKGGATVRVLRPGDDPSASALLKRFREHGEMIAGYFTDDAAGYVIVMWDRSGFYSRARYATRGSPYPQRMVPAVVRDILDQDTMAGVTRGVLRGDE